jgi:hypothetical protein
MSIVPETLGETRDGLRGRSTPCGRTRCARHMSVRNNFES